jgi:hypothetical protein
MQCSWREGSVGYWFSTSGRVAQVIERRLNKPREPRASASRASTSGIARSLRHLRSSGEGSSTGSGAGTGLDAILLMVGASATSSLARMGTPQVIEPATCRSSR